MRFINKLEFLDSKQNITYFVTDPMLDSPQFPGIGQNLDGSISYFGIYENCHKSRTSHDIGMKLGPVTKLDKRNTATSKTSDDDVMSENCNVIVFFSDL